MSRASDQRCMEIFCIYGMLATVVIVLSLLCISIVALSELMCRLLV